MRRTPAQIYALTVGVTLLAAGVLGFFYSSDFSTGEAVSRPENRDAVLGLLDVNGWHNLVHILTGALGLAVAGSFTAARPYALGMGAAYGLVLVLGLAGGDQILGLLPINAADNVLHGALAVLGIVMGLASQTVPDPTTA